jgi:hypothetical protein
MECFSPPLSFGRREMAKYMAEQHMKLIHLAQIYGSSIAAPAYAEI